MEYRIYYTTIGMKLCWITMFMSIFLTAIFGIDYRLVIVFLCCTIYLAIGREFHSRIDIEKPDYIKIKGCRHRGMGVARGKCKGRR